MNDCVGMRMSGWDACNGGIGSVADKFSVGEIDTHLQRKNVIRDKNGIFFPFRSYDVIEDVYTGCPRIFARV
jgi:hypothetical protein